MTAKQFRELHHMIDQIFAEADALGLSWPELARAAGIGVVTIYRLGNFDTLYPRAQTILLLARAVELTVKLEKVTKEKPCGKILKYSKPTKRIVSVL